MGKRMSIMVAAGAALWLGGCASPDNARLTLGDGAAPSFVVEGEPMTAGTAASVTGTDRSGWAAVGVSAAMDETRTNWRGVNERRTSNARHGGLFPSAEGALDLSGTACCPRGPGAWARHPGAGAGAE